MKQIFSILIPQELLLLEANIIFLPRIKHHK